MMTEQHAASVHKANARRESENAASTTEAIEHTTNVAIIESGVDRWCG